MADEVKLHDLIFDGMVTFTEIDGCAVHVDAEGFADYLIAYGVTFADVPDNNVGKWIPVSERLPDANGVYLSVDDMGIYSFRVFDPNKRMWKAIWEDEKVTHWMPLPEPPKEGE